MITFSILLYTKHKSKVGIELLERGGDFHGGRVVGHWHISFLTKTIIVNFSNFLFYRSLKGHYYDPLKWSFTYKQHA